VHFDKLFWMRWGLVACVLIACSSKGAVIEIHTTADHVKVYASADDCSIDNNGQSTPCQASIAWASAGPNPPVDHSFALLDGFPLVVPVKGGIANLELRGTVDQDQLKRVIVIGYDPSGTPVASARIVAPIKIPQDSADVWRLDLQPAEDITATQDPNTAPRNGIAQRIHTWPADSTPRCVVWQQYDGAKWVREVIAPSDDHDCDGFDSGASVECDDFWFDFKGASSGSACVGTDNTGSGSGSGTGSACTLGTQVGSCIDGSGGSTGCLQHTAPIYCAPDIVCTSCGNPFDSTCPGKQYDLPANPTTPSYACTIPTDPASASPIPCITGSSKSSASIPFPCTQVQLTSRELPPLTMYGGTTAAFIDNGASFIFQSVQSSTSCEADLTFAGGAPMQSEYSFTLNVYVNVNGSPRVLVIPIAYHFSNTTVCDVSTPCTPNLAMGNTGSGSGSDGMWDCLR
jgi:hypothetical protein